MFYMQAQDPGLNLQKSLGRIFIASELESPIYSHLIEICQEPATSFFSITYTTFLSSPKPDSHCIAEEKKEKNAIQSLKGSFQEHSLFGVTHSLILSPQLSPDSSCPRWYHGGVSDFEPWDTGGLLSFCRLLGVCGITFSHLGDIGAQVCNECNLCRVLSASLGLCGPPRSLGCSLGLACTDTPEIQGDSVLTLVCLGYSASWPQWQPSWEAPQLTFH